MTPIPDFFFSQTFSKFSIIIAAFTSVEGSNSYSVFFASFAFSDLFSTSSRNLAIKSSISGLS